MKSSGFRVRRPDCNAYGEAAPAAGSTAEVAPGVTRVSALGAAALLLGGELMGWGVQKGHTYVARGAVVFTVLYYPSPRGACT